MATSKAKLKTRTRTKPERKPRLIVAYPMNDELYAQCAEEIEDSGVTHAKLVRDALLIAFAYKEGSLRSDRLPKGVVCFGRKSR